MVEIFDNLTKKLQEYQNVLMTFIDECKEIIEHGYSSEGTGVRTRLEDGTYFFDLNEDVSVEVLFKMN